MSRALPELHLYRQIMGEVPRISDLLRDNVHKIVNQSFATSRAISPYTAFVLYLAPQHVELMSKGPKEGMTVEKVSLAVLAVLGVVGLAYFIATTLEVLPTIGAS